MALKKIVLPLTVAAGGGGTATAPNAVNGVLYSVEYVKTDYADGVDFTVNCLNSGMTDLIMTVSNANASARYYPRDDSHKASDGSALSLNNMMIPIFGRPSISVTSGGTSTSGTFIIWILD